MNRPRPIAPPRPFQAPDPLLPFAERVVRWQRLQGRHGLPWQGTRDPYRVWLSEIMLQQTQVATVLDHYARFLLRFPDLVRLANASQDEVLAVWSGLGYYSRARNLHRCAQVVVQEHGGQFPSSSAALVRLPGIGRSTAAAIAAFCFDERAAILDGNVKRVLTRALGFVADLAQAANERALWATAEQLLPTHDIAVYTQGLMDLGATVCKLREPACPRCPLQADCTACREGEPQRYPVKSKKLKRGRREHALLWLVQGRRCWMVQRPPSGVWASMWSLPEWDDAQTLLAATAAWPGRTEPLPTVHHVLTHFDWTLRPLRHQLPDRLDATQCAAVNSSLESKGAGRWVTREEALELALAAPIRRLLEAWQA